ncbi:putative ligase protein [Candidatus Paraburkholderia calva]|nr:putative ligase protein [Candidatus Paraburkholderia calva]
MRKRHADLRSTSTTSHRLALLCLNPDEPTAARITGLTDRLRTAHDLQAKPIPADRLISRSITSAHSKVFPPTSSIEPTPPPRASRLPVAGHAGAHRMLRGAPRQASARPRRQGQRTARHARRSLATALNAAGIATKRHPHFTPHVTLLYTGERIAPPTVDPLTCTAREFTLMRSFLGRSRHEVIARWPLSP